jgi:hypothetical protein
MNQRTAARSAAAIALAVVTIASTAACQNITQASVPAPPACPSGQQWAALSTSKYGCTADNAR